MRWTNWLRAVGRGLRRTMLAGRAVAGRRRNAWRGEPLSFERLEDRTLLATLTVNIATPTNVDDAFLSLLEAIAVVNDGNPADGVAALGGFLLSPGEAAQVNTTEPFGTNDTIVFAASTDGTAQVLTGDTALAADGSLQITKAVRIIGNGAANTIVDGNNARRIFDIAASVVNVTFSDLTLQNGRTTGVNANFNDNTFSGGGIRSQLSGLLTITNSVLNNNRVGSEAYGGAVFVNIGSLSVTNSTLSNNYAEYGGAIYLKGNSNATITGSTLTGNVAADGGGAIYAGYNGASSVTIQNSTLSNNQAVKDGGAIEIDTGSVSIEGSTVSGNSTTTSEGGAIYADAATVQITNSTVSGNSTTGTSDDHGGAIYASSGNVTVLNSTFSGNSTAGNNSLGGAVYVRTGNITITSSTFSGNSTAGTNSHGGAIASPVDGNVTIINSTLSGNSVNGTSTRGGALYFDDGDVLIVNSTITNNMARIGGGIGYFADDIGESLTIINSIIAGNTAPTGKDIAATDSLNRQDPANNLRVRNSLIGSNSGVALTADAAATFTDAIQTASFVGAGAGFSAAQIGLAALANNGGPTQTHALLATSLALNSGDSTRATTNGLVGGTAIANDQRGAPFVRIFGAAVDMGAFESQALQSIIGNVATFVGTPNADQFQGDLATATVIVNGVAYVLPNTVTSLMFDGLAGSDTFTLLGTAGAEIVRLLPGQAFLDNSSVGVTGSATSFEIVTYVGNGGADQATLTGGPSTDKFVGRATQSFFTGPGFFNVARGVATVIADSPAGGIDTAFLFDTNAANTFTANGLTAAISGTGITANNFETAVGYASGGTDTANFTGSAVKDILLARQIITTLTGAGIIRGAVGFEVFSAAGGNGGDIARLFGRAGVDTFTAGPANAVLAGTNYQYSVSGFETVIAAAAGPGDLAVLQDSAGNDQFIGRGGSGTLIATNAFTAENFSQITIRGTNGGTNRRTLTPPLTFTLIEQGTWV